MRMRALLSIPAVLLLVGCTAAPDGDLPGALAAGSPTGPSTIQHGSWPDISGEWSWSVEEIIRMPPFVAGLVGITPEGPNTHARCKSTGVMTLVQSGSSFTGTSTRTSNNCATNGGQSFQQPAVAFQIADGRIHGRSVEFSINSPTVAPCPYRAVMSFAGGIAAALNGTGHCVLPGHPQSESVLPLDPPPGGTTNAINWKAVRQ